MADENKLQIDDDWKSEAAAEKERLAKSVEEKPPRELPEADFSGLINMLAMQAMVGLGGVAGPDGRQIPPNPDIAKHHIDLLDVLETKTKGNLEPQEKQLLDTALHQLRLAYVEAVRGPAMAPGSESPQA